LTVIQAHTSVASFEKHGEWMAPNIPRLVPLLASPLLGTEAPRGRLAAILTQAPDVVDFGAVAAGNGRSAIRPVAPAGAWVSAERGLSAQGHARASLTMPRSCQ
jgi:hypothetical protein